MVFTAVAVQYTCVSLTQLLHSLYGTYEYKYLCEYKYLLTLLNSIRSTSTYAPKFTVFILTIGGYPKIKSFCAPGHGLSSLRVESNMTVTFTCEARGAAPLRYVWKCDGRVIDQEGSSTLKVENVKQGGEYSCRVENEFGSETSEPIPLVVGKSNNCLHVYYQIPLLESDFSSRLH